MAITAIFGSQWGDEGKGKISDSIGTKMDVVARFQGGANAGHTIYLGDNKIVLHQVPSGILSPNCHCVLGNGMVIDPVALVDEIQLLNEAGVSTADRIHIAFNIHLVTPIHKAIDQAVESASNNRIGTTGRGIGPAYVDKYSRRGIRGHDLLINSELKTKLEKRLLEAIRANEIYDIDPDSIRDQFDNYIHCAELITKYVEDTFSFLYDKSKEGKNILIEGAQGTLLDVDHGTYPFVTSSNPTIGGISTGLGLPISAIDRRIGVFKAYCTRVGNGPFPTELFDDYGAKIRNIGKEFGATTGRPRRCGWFDGVAAKYSCFLNNLDEIALTKLDTLDSFEEIKVCVGYKYEGQKVSSIMEILHKLERVDPVYETIQGWNESTVGIEHFEELPIRAKQYCRFITELLETPVKIISTGPERNQIITR